MNFCAIDFETATNERNSACEVGLCMVENNKIVSTKSWLIRPPSFPHFNRHNIAVHGIYPSDVANSPTFADIWQELHQIIGNKMLVAHNASFDAGVLRGCLEYYNIPKPELQYVCSVQIARKSWLGLPSYSLGNLARQHEISFNHHRAGDDAEVCAKISLLAFQELMIGRDEDVQMKLKSNLKIL
ncbi:MAG: 3'-5' exonuclease [Bacteroidetes bacterium]|nr:3'-5' exonuclease [Bacteroidota bacterium]